MSTNEFHITNTLSDLCKDNLRKGDLLRTTPHESNPFIYDANQHK